MTFGLVELQLVTLLAQLGERVFLRYQERRGEDVTGLTKEELVELLRSLVIRDPDDLIEEGRSQVQK